MSLSAQKAAWAATVPAVEKLVLLCLADHAANTGRCWPSIERISERCGLHRSSVMRSIKALAKGGHISILRTFGRPNHYVVQALDSDTSRTAQPVAESDTSLTATGSQMALVAHGDSTSSTPQPDPSLSATPPVAQSDTNLLRIYQEPPMNPAPKRRRVKAVQKTPAFHQEVINAYHEKCPDFPKVKMWTPDRHRLLTACIAERLEAGKPADTIGYWFEYFERAAASGWLCGRGRDNDWLPGIDWLLKEKNFAKVIEGNYDDGTRRSMTNGGARAHG
jgi:hypothetical protein